MKFPEFKPGEQLSAGKLNRLSAGARAAQTQAGPGIHIDSSASGSQMRSTQYKRIGIGRTGGTLPSGLQYPQSYDLPQPSITTSYPFEFVDIDHDLTPAIKERGDVFTLRNIPGHYLPADTLVEVLEHRGEWYTSFAPVQDYDVIKVRNDYPFTIPRYAPIGIDNPIYDPSVNEASQEYLFRERVFSGTKPVTPRHTNRYAILTQELAPCEIGTAVMSGVVPSGIEYSHPSDHYKSGLVAFSALGDDAITQGVRRGQRHELKRVDSGTGASGRTMWSGNWWSRAAHTGPDDFVNGADCSVAGTCEYECSGGVWTVTSESCPTGCSCAAKIEPLSTAFPMPCSDGATVSRTDCGEAASTSLTVARISNEQATVSDLDAQDCDYTTCTFTCTETATDVWNWVVTSDNCSTGPSYCSCGQVPGWYNCDEDTCPNEVTFGCVPVVSTTTTTTTPPTTSCPPVLDAACTGDGCCVWECANNEWFQTRGCGFEADDCCCDSQPDRQANCTNGDTYQSACDVRSCGSGECKFEGFDAGSNSYRWDKVRSCCTDECSCCEPQIRGDYWDGVTVSLDCGDCCQTCPTTLSSQRCWWRYTAGSNSWALETNSCPSGCGCKNLPTEAPSNGPADQTLLGIPCCRTSATTTTTSAPPCGVCNYNWDSVSWNLNSDSCTGACACVAPATDGTVFGESRETTCEVPATTTTTTTTTSAAPCTGSCEAFCNNGEWVRTSSTCASVGNCNCCYFDVPCSHGQTRTVECVYDPGTTVCTTTTTTTSTPPVTTTTTSTTTSTPPVTTTTTTTTSTTTSTPPATTTTTTTTSATP